MDKVDETLVEIEKKFLPGLHKERCSDCWHTAKKEDLYCHECGTLLDPDRPGVSAMLMKMHCSRCGYPNELGNKCCTQCGNIMGR